MENEALDRALRFYKSLPMEWRLKHWAKVDFSVADGGRVVVRVPEKNVEFSDDIAEFPSPTLVTSLLLVL